MPQRWRRFEARSRVVGPDLRHFHARARMANFHAVGARASGGASWPCRSVSIRPLKHVSPRQPARATTRVADSRGGPSLRLERGFKYVLISNTCGALVRQRRRAGHAPLSWRAAGDFFRFNNDDLRKSGAWGMDSRRDSMLGSRPSCVPDSTHRTVGISNPLRGPRVPGGAWSRAGSPAGPDRACGVLEFDG